MGNGRSIRLFLALGMPRARPCSELCVARIRDLGQLWWLCLPPLAAKAEAGRDETDVLPFVRRVRRAARSNNRPSQIINGKQVPDQCEPNAVPCATVQRLLATLTPTSSSLPPKCRSYAGAVERPVRAGQQGNCRHHRAGKRMAGSVRGWLLPAQHPREAPHRTAAPLPLSSHLCPNALPGRREMSVVAAGKREVLSR